MPRFTVRAGLCLRFVHSFNHESTRDSYVALALHKQVEHASGQLSDARDPSAPTQPQRNVGFIATSLQRLDGSRRLCHVVESAHAAQPVPHATGHAWLAVVPPTPIQPHRVAGFAATLEQVWAAEPRLCQLEESAHVSTMPSIQSLQVDRTTGGYIDVFGEDTRKRRGRLHHCTLKALTRA